ncbi:hypothetical protein D047_2934A, partial [Vibrio parahaemolyticus VPTS-2010_2]
MRFKPLSILR